MTTTLRGWIDLSARAKYRLRGPDRVRYLNGQVTNNVARLLPGGTCQALICTHKGRIEGEVFIRALPEALLIDAPGELREPLFQRLGKYLIADDCELEDVTEEFTLWHELSSEAPVDEPRVDRYGTAGRDVWSARGEEAQPPGFITPERVEAWRVAKGIPAWGAELSPEVFPQEARMEARAIDFRKGCYVGQEIVSRLRSVGQVNRLLQGLESLDNEVSDCEVLPDRAAPLLTESGLTAGSLTSVIKPPDGGPWLALGYVKRSLIQSDVIFQTVSDEDARARRWKLREISLS